MKEAAMKKRMIALALAFTLAASTLLTGCGIVKVIKIDLFLSAYPRSSRTGPRTNLCKAEAAVE